MQLIFSKYGSHELHQILFPGCAPPIVGPAVSSSVEDAVQHDTAVMHVGRMVFRCTLRYAGL